jgi:hypothetical protein
VLANGYQVRCGDHHAKVQEAACPDPDPTWSWSREPHPGLEQDILADLKAAVPKSFEHISV